MSAALRAALAELVACKDLKEEHDRLDQRNYLDNRINPLTEAEVGRWRATLEGYTRRQPLAWAAARAALAGEHEPAAPALTDEQIIEAWDVWPRTSITSRAGAVSFVRAVLAAIERPAQPEPVAWMRSDGMKAMPADEKEAWIEAGDAFLVAEYTIPLYGLATPAPGEQPANPSEGHAGVEDVRMCACKDRPASECAEEWGPDCDLGNNPKFARRRSPETQAAIEAALTPSEAPSAKEAREWVSVEERMPEHAADALVFVPGDDYSAERMFVDVWDAEEGEWFDEGPVTHWMPLPPPPITHAEGEKR